MIPLLRRVEDLLHLGSRDLLPPIERIHAVDLLFDIGAVGSVYKISKPYFVAGRRGWKKERGSKMESGNRKTKM